VFLAVHRGLGTFEGRLSTRTWVYGICIRVCADYRRKQARRREQPTTSKSTQQEGRTPERALAASETLNALDAALANLADGQRDIFVLYEIEGLSMPEVSAALGCPLFTAYARLHAARRRVRTDLVDHLKAEK